MLKYPYWKKIFPYCKKKFPYCKSEFALLVPCLKSFAVPNGNLNYSLNQAASCPC
jgi:hypothetical protein